MFGTVFYETLRRGWRQMLYWGIGLAIYALYPFVMMPNNEGLSQYADLIGSMDPAMARAFGIDNAATLTTPEGFVGFAFFGYILVILGVYAVIAGLNVTAAEEDNGIMDMFLSLPVARWHIIVEKIAAHAVMITGISLMSLVGLLLGEQIARMDVNLDKGYVLQACLGIVPPVVLMMAFTVFVGTLVRRRSMATAIAGGFVVISYLLNAVGNVANNRAGDAMKQVSLFFHYDGTNILLTGLTASSVILLTVAAVMLISASLALFQRRDIAV